MRSDSRRGSSAYATGGGGYTFERRVATGYLARLITESSAPELGSRAVVRRVAFQQSHSTAVDDVVVHASASGSGEPDIELTVSIRRNLRFTASDQASRDIFKEITAALSACNRDRVERRVAVAVSGASGNAREVAQLCDLARDHSCSRSLVDDLGTAGRWPKGLRSRFDAVLSLVRAALVVQTDIPEPSEDAVADRTWHLLSYLYVLLRRVEPPDETDWGQMAEYLRPVTRSKSAEAGVNLRDALYALAAEYAPQGASVDSSLVRRAVHDHLDSRAARSAHAWQILHDLDRDLRNLVRGEIGAPGSVTHRIEREAALLSLRGLLDGHAAVVVHGTSGVGKSSLVLRVMDAMLEAGDAEFVAFGFADLPSTAGQMRGLFRVDLSALLKDMSAPARFLLVDGVDLIVDSEERRHLLGSIARSCRDAEVQIVVTCKPTSVEAVRSTLGHPSAPVREWELGGLTDDEVRDLCSRIPNLRSMCDRASGMEILRLPKVADLLARSKRTGSPLTEAGALTVVWKDVVRNQERSDYGTAEAREQSLLKLVEHELSDESKRHQPARNLAAVRGLRADGLLRPPSVVPWRHVPEFAHEVVRDYAVAWKLASGDIGQCLRAYGVPRWTLPAARLACQVQLENASDLERPRRFVQLWNVFNGLSADGYGERWSDVPTEAVLRGTASEETLAELWRLREADQTRALGGVIRSTRNLRNGPLMRLDIAERVARLLVERRWPAALNSQVDRFVTDWLFVLVVCSTERGHPTRVRLRTQLLQELERESKEYERRWGRRLVPRVHEGSSSPDQVTTRSDGDRGERVVVGHYSGRRTAEFILPTLALLGPDLGDVGAEQLRRAAKAAPKSLKRVVETVGPPAGVTQWSVELLAELTAAYYIDSEADEEEWFQQNNFRYEDGIRSHLHLGLAPLGAGWDRGPFIVLGRADFGIAVTTINQILNHAARVRSRGMGQAPRRWAIHDPDAEYFGDSHVWLWHSGTGIGPLPCMSALQALDMVCTERIRSRHSLESTVNTLLAGCANIGMVALVVRLIVRNIERAGVLLDPFFAEPEIWELETSRFGADRINIHMLPPTDFAKKRRDWTLERAAIWTVYMQVLQSGDSRRGEVLRETASILLETGEARISEANLDKKGTEWHGAVLRKWAAHLDSDTYRVQVQGQGLAVEAQLPEDVAEVLQRGITEVTQDTAVEECWFKYEPNRQSMGTLAAEIDSGTVKADVARVREWYERTGGRGSLVAVNGAGSLAAGVILAHAHDQGSVGDDDVAWARDRLLELAHYVCGEERATDSGIDFSPGRLAALALPALWRQVSGMTNGREASTIESALLQLSGSESRDTRLYLAVGLDAIFSGECTSGVACRHVRGLNVIHNLAGKADIRLRTKDGAWRPRDRCDAFVRAIDSVPDDLLDIGFLVPAIRAAGVAATATTCVRDDAYGTLAAG